MGWLSKDNGGTASDQAPEARGTRRKTPLGTRCIIELEDGTVHEGQMVDISPRGAGVHGSTDGVHLGDHLRLIASDESGGKVRYRCEVRHVNRLHRQFGVEFVDRPEQVAPDYVPKPNEPEAPEQIRKGCPRCGQGMEYGYLVEHVHITSSLERIVQARWAAGAPRRDPWRTEDIPQPVQYLRVDTYRCKGCGYIECYANSPYEGP
jgi:hypothetical protein